MTNTQIIDESLIDSCFPKATYRTNQREVIQGIVWHINNGKRFVIAECPTGAGKSAIAVTLAKLAGEGRAYYITTTKLLQDQIENDFQGNDVVTLKGRNAYQCTVYDTHEQALLPHLGRAKLDKMQNELVACDDGYCKSSLGRGSCKLCVPNINDVTNGKVSLPIGMQYSTCPYFEKLFGAAGAQTASMNFSNFILHLNFGNKFSSRRILVIDEAHNAEEKLLQFLETSISSTQIDHAIPEFETAIEYVRWFKSIDVFGILKEKYTQAVEAMDTKASSMYENLLRQYAMMSIEVTQRPHEWVCEFESGRLSTKATLKPIFVKQAAHNYLFKHADVVIFLSATILNANVFARNLGIDDGEFAALRVPSTFPVANRPIIKDYAGTFTGGKAKMDQWIGDMARKVEEIAERYPNDRGIIHTHSFNIQKCLIDRLKQSVTSRLTQQQDYVTKNEMIEDHARKPGSIIIAPAMHEGVDLKDDLSRFQIVCKIPYANFYDNKQLKARMDQDGDYYNMITMLKLCQSVGRSIRSETDWADTYIIDGSFDRLYGRGNSFPEWFKEAVIDFHKWKQQSRQHHAV